MPDTYNIARHYEEVAAGAADFPALIGSDIALSHGQFWRVVNRLAGHLEVEGVGPGATVVLNSNTMVVVLATVMATGLLGAGFACASRALAEAGAVRPTHYYRTADLSGHPAVPFRILDLAWLGDGTADAPPVAPRGTDPDAPWIYLHTSGTTGAPKFIALSQRIVRDRSLAAAIDFPRRATTFATTFPCTSRPFLARALAALLQGCAIVDGQDPDLWHRAGVNFVAGSPMQLLDWLGDRRLDPPFARLEVSGARLPTGAAARYLRSFEQVFDVYGASETSKSFANLLRRDPSGAIVAEGRPLDSEVQILRPDGAPAAPNEIGRVRVRNPYMAPGYLAAPEATARAFRDGWFHPGDLAYFDGQGALVVVGRDDDVINIGGLKLHGSLLDEVIGSVSGVTAAMAVRNPIPGAADPLIAFVVLDAETNHHRVSEDIIAAVHRAFGFGLSPRNIKLMTDLPRSDGGTPDRRKGEAMVLERARALGELS